MVLCAAVRWWGCGGVGSGHGDYAAVSHTAFARCGRRRSIAGADEASEAAAERAEGEAQNHVTGGAARVQDKVGVVLSCAPLPCPSPLFLTPLLLTDARACAERPSRLGVGRLPLVCRYRFELQDDDCSGTSGAGEHRGSCKCCMPVNARLPHRHVGVRHSDAPTSDCAVGHGLGAALAQARLTSRSSPR